MVTHTKRHRAIKTLHVPFAKDYLRRSLIDSEFTVQGNTDRDRESGMFWYQLYCDIYFVDDGGSCINYLIVLHK